MTIKITRTKSIDIRWDRKHWEIDVAEGSKWTWALVFDELDQRATTYRFGHGYTTYAHAFKALEFQVARLEKTGHKVHHEVIELETGENA